MGSIGNGISYSGAGVLQALGNLQATALGSVENTIASLVGPWRPAQWSGPAQTSIRVPGTASVAYSTSSLGVVNGGSGTPITDDQGNPLNILAATGVGLNTNVTATPDIIYVFDGVLKVEHTQEVELTQHPVQNGANISDHAYIKAARVSMDILMSDAMSSYTLGQWSGAKSKSVNAYQTLLALQIARQPLIITTRLNVYTNMVLQAIHAPDDFRTKHGLRATVIFQQIFVASVATQNAVSSRPQDTGSTGTGSIPTTSVPDSVTNNYSAQPAAPGAPIVTGAGDFSSFPIGS